MENTKKLIDFIGESTDAFHAAEAVRRRLTDSGFKELREDEEWEIEAECGYFVIRNLSSVIAFRVPKNPDGFHITASHIDSPCFKLKRNFEIEQKGMVKLSVEGYGGMLKYTWLDRPLSVSGRVVCVRGGKLDTRLVNIDRDILIIPSLAPHLDRGIDKGYEFNIKTDMCPIAGEKSGSLIKLIADAANVCEDEIKSFDLSVYNRMKGTLLAADGEFFGAPRIDDLQCVYSTLAAFLEAKGEKRISVFAAFDNEEVGSGTRQGALSTFLSDTLERVSHCIGADYKRLLCRSLMLSCDNAHAIHPNHPDKYDSQNCAVMNGGIVIKRNENQSYTTDAVSEAAVVYLCEKADVPYQRYANRSDILGGRTLGNLSIQKVSVKTADIGLAQLAMHSAFETAGTKDTTYMIKLVKEFFESGIEFR